MNFHAKNMVANPLNKRENPPRTRNENTTVSNVRADKPLIKNTTVMLAYSNMLSIASFFNLGNRAPVNNRQKKSGHAKGNPP